MMRYKKEIFVFFLIFFVMVIWNYYFQLLTGDEIWTYGFSFNISNGLIPYRDFNMIVPPLYMYPLGMMIRVFGNYFILLAIYNSILEIGIMVLLYRKISWKCLLYFPLLLFLLTNAGYNILCLFLFLVFLEIYERKIMMRDFYLGLIVCLLVLTKQTVGGILLIVTFFLAKDKRKFLLGFLPIAMLFFWYLFQEHAFIEFWDYCFLGMFDFTSNNVAKDFDLLKIIYFMALIGLIKLFVTKKDKKLLFILIFQIIAFPIIDIYHILIAIIPILLYLHHYHFKSRYTLIFTSFFFFLALFYNIIDVLEANNHVQSLDFMRGKNSKTDFSFVSKLNHYIDEHYADYDLYFFSDIAYLIKIDGKRVINKYDLINNGNMGYNGTKKYIKELDDKCSIKKCLFVLDAIDTSGQINLEIINHIKKTYVKQNEIYNFIILKNK